MTSKTLTAEFFCYHDVSLAFKKVGLVGDQVILLIPILKKNVRGLDRTEEEVDVIESSNKQLAMLVTAHLCPSGMDSLTSFP